VHDLTGWRQDEHGVEVAVGHDLGPASLALHDDVGLVQPGQRGQAFDSGPGISMNRSRAASVCGRSNASSVKPVKAPSERAISFTGMLMLTIDIAACTLSSTMSRLTAMCLRSAMP